MRNPAGLEYKDFPATFWVDEAELCCPSCAEHLTLETKAEKKQILTVTALVGQKFAKLEREWQEKKAQGFSHKIWRTVGVSGVRSSHASVNRVKIPIDDYFTVGNHKMFLPSDPGVPLQLSANCRCYVTYSKTDQNCQELIQQLEMAARKKWHADHDLSNSVQRITKAYEKLDQELDTSIAKNLLLPLADFVGSLALSQPIGAATALYSLVANIAHFNTELAQHIEATLFPLVKQYDRYQEVYIYEQSNIERIEKEMERTGCGKSYGRLLDKGSYIKNGQKV